MTPEAQRIAIAQACGWKIENYGPSGYEKLYWRLRRPDGIIIVAEMTGEACSRSQFVHSAPNYLKDLNVIHEAEKRLTEEQWEIYLRILSRNITRTWWEGARAVCHATAAQRSEAFLKTLNLWDDSK